MTVKSKFMYIIMFLPNVLNCLHSRLKQNMYNMNDIRNAKKLVIFLIPYKDKINGGVMSIYTMCNISRNINKDSLCMLITTPGFFTYSDNKYFKNNEVIYRFDQLINSAKNLETCILNIPDYYAGKFYNNLTEHDIKFFQNIKNLQINIMNQNIELMPEPTELQNLYKLTNNITQTTAHTSYTNQDVCNKWKMPLHFFGYYVDYSEYKSVPFEQKEKIIVLSPDNNEYKPQIINKLKREFRSWKFITVKNMTFPQYMELIAKASFVITFGEGMDGYFLQPSIVKTKSFAVYNDRFFTDVSWKNLDNVYESYEEMAEKIVYDIKNMISNKDLYYKDIETPIKKFEESHKSLSKEDYIDNLQRFYNQQYDFYPKEE